MKDFQHHTPALRLHHGGGALAELARELDRLGCRRAVVFCGASMARPGGGLERVAGVLGERLALFDPKTRAQAVFIDAGMLASAPVPLLRGAGLNALAMAVEGLESAQGDPLSDALLMHAVRLLARGLPRLEAMPDDAGLRGELVLAAILAGQGTDLTGGGLASVLGHAIGPRCGVVNGIVNAIVLPHTLRFNASHTGERLCKLAASLPASGGAGSAGDPLEAIAAVEALLARLPLPRRLRETGLLLEDIPAVVAQAQADFFLRRNPRPVRGGAELARLLDACW